MFIYDASPCFVHPRILLRSASAPSKPRYLSKVKCNLRAEQSIARQDGIALGLDGAGFIPGESTAAAALQYGIATASAFNSAFHSDSNGIKLGGAGALLAIISGVQSTMGPATWAKAIPIVSYIANTAASLNDLASAYAHGAQAYGSCISTP